MDKQSLTIKPLICKLMVSSCALLSAVPSLVWAQTYDGQNPSGLSARDAAVFSARGAASPGGLPMITSPRQGARNYESVQPIQSRPQTKAATDDKDSFEDYVEKVVDKRLNIFGKELFSNVPDTFAPAGAVQVNPDYVIGTGDELQIRGWGMVDIDLSTSVDRSGAIYIPRVGEVKVAGIKYRDLQDYLRKAVGKIYTNFDLTVSVAQTRAVQVYVVGHVVRPGTYTLSAMSTLLNALFVSGGPDGSGTMRNIQVKRGSATVTSFDLYDMLVKGDKSHDISLRDGDVIYVPEVGPLVALTGDVKKPAVYELKGPSSIADAITWAGGFDSAADQKLVIVEKNVDNNYQTVAELTADKEALTGPLAGIPLQPTDILRVFSPSAVPVQVQVQNEYVRVAGEIKHSGVFQIKKGETLRELIARLGGATENGYIYALKLNRESVRRSQQERLDEVTTRFERDIESTAADRIAGTTDKDNIATVNAEVDRQRRLAQKMRLVKAEGRIVLELSGAEAEVKNLPDLALQDGDYIYIPRKPGTVNVLGAVFQQNSFIYRPRRSVGDYLDLAGGATATADTSEMYVIRADGTAQSGRSSGWFSGLRGAKINPGDTVVVPEKIERNSLTQDLKEWTTILYQFGLGAAGLKVLKD